MPISKADLIPLRQKIETEKRKHDAGSAACQQELDALDVIEKRLASEHQVPLDLESPQQPQPHVSFSESVRQSVHHFKDEEFTVSNVESVLKVQGIPLPANNLRTRIAIEVKDLLRKGTITLVRAGSGNTPHVYRRVLLIQPRGGPEKGEAGATTPASVRH